MKDPGEGELGNKGIKLNFDVGLEKIEIEIKGTKGREKMTFGNPMKIESDINEILWVLLYKSIKRSTRLIES